jgi:hypothetical protein
MATTRRVGYHDFTACTAQLSSGKYQGFVLVQHHTLVGVVQWALRAGRSTAEEEDAFACAERKAAALIRIALEGSAQDLSIRKAA